MGVEAYKLYIRLPRKILDEAEIKDLHPNIEKVYLPRQKSRRWCVVDFESNQGLEEAKTALKKLKIDGRNIVVKPFTVRQKRNKEVPLKSADSSKPLLDLLQKE